MTGFHPIILHTSTTEILLKFYILQLVKSLTWSLKFWRNLPPRNQAIVGSNQALSVTVPILREEDPI